MTELQLAEERAERLSRRDRDGIVNHHYTRFVRIMRLALPLASALVIFIVFLRIGGTDDKITPVERTAQTPEIQKEDVTRNELVNPRFVSVDKKNQPFEIVAERAVQGDTNKDLIMLERPVGKMNLESGGEVKMSALSGAYRQDTERFFLEGNVVLDHTDGYTLSGSEAHVDMKQNIAWSEKDVTAVGPDVNINAKGLRVNGKTGEIVFTGPAKLIFEGGFKGLE